MSWRRLGTTTEPLTLTGPAGTLVLGCGPVYIQEQPTPGEIECCTPCAELRVRQPSITPDELVRLHPLLHDAPPPPRDEDELP